MKRIKYQILLIAIAMMVGCNNDWVQPTDDYALGYAVCSIDAKTEIPQCNMGDTLIFYDLSMGVISSLWTLPESTTLIAGELDEDYIAARFEESGIYQVDLNSTLIGDVDYSQTFYVNVLEELQSTFIMAYMSDTGDTDDDGEPIYEEIRLDSLDRFTMEAAQYELTFASVGPGSPYYYDWVLEGSDNEWVEKATDSVHVANYYTMGTYDVMLVTSRTSPWGCDTLLVKDFITITAPTSDVKVRGIAQNESDQIAISFTSAMPTPSVSVLTDFEVIRNGVSMTPTAIALNSKDITQYLLTIDGGMWNGDEVTVSYTGTTIEGLAGNSLATFENVEAEPLIVNLIANGDFESDDNLPILISRTTWTEMDYCDGIGISTDQAYSGDRSFYYYVPANAESDGVGRCLRPASGDYFYMERGVDYMFEYRWYATTLYAWASFGLECSSWMYSVTTVSGSTALWTDPIGEWKQNSAIINIADYEEAEQNSYFYSLGHDASELSVYLDDIRLYEYKKHE